MAVRRVPRLTVRPRQGEVLQWTFTGLSDVAPCDPRVWRQQIPKDCLTEEQKKELKSLKAKAYRQGKQRSNKVDLPKKVTVVAPVSPRRLQQSRLDLLPPPQTMDAAALGRAASVAARDPACSSSPVLWSSLAERAIDLLPSLDPQDLSQLLSGMARARHKEDKTVVELMFKSVIARRGYFSSRQLATTLGALAKLDVGSRATWLPLLGELLERVPELRGAGELAVPLSALARLQRSGGSSSSNWNGMGAAEMDEALKESDVELEFGKSVTALVKALAGQIDLRLGADSFHARELAAVSAAYTQLSYMDSTRTHNLAMCARATLHEASPSELSRLVALVAQCGGSSSSSASPPSRAKAASLEVFVSEAVGQAAEKVDFMLPEELAEATLAFGQAFEHGLGGLATQGLLEKLLGKAAVIAPQLKFRELASLLQSCARWRLGAGSEDVAHRLADGLYQRLPATRVEDAQPIGLADGCRALHSLGAMLVTSASPAALQVSSRSESSLSSVDSTSETSASSHVLAAASRLEPYLRSMLEVKVSVADDSKLKDRHDHDLDRVVEALFCFQLSCRRVGLEGAGSSCVFDGQQATPSLADLIERRFKVCDRSDSSHLARRAAQLRLRLLGAGGSSEDPEIRVLEGVSVAISRNLVAE